MNTEKFRWKLWFGFGFAFTAGFADIIGLKKLNGFFMSFMTGNTTSMAIKLANAEWSAVLELLLVIGFYIVGSAIGNRVARQYQHRAAQAILTVEIIFALLVSVFSFFYSGWLLAPLLALIMGIQAAAHFYVRNIDLGRGYIDAIIYQFGVALAESFRHKRSWVDTGIYAFSIITFAIGCAAGMAVAPLFSVPAMLAMLCAGIAILLSTTFMVPKSVGNIGSR